MTKKPKVLIAGGSGFIGYNLANLLISERYEVAILTRKLSNKPKLQEYLWDVDNQKIDSLALEDVDYIINLAGTSIADRRWSSLQKRKIEQSRTKSTLLLFNSVKKLKEKPKVYISASAIGYYGTFTSNEIFSESQPNGNDFLAGVCKKWEDATHQFESLGIRTVILRTGVVFDPYQGAFPKMTRSLRYGFAAGIGSGLQIIPWIHLDDLINIYLFAIQNKQMIGIYNAVAPDYITQNELTNKIKVFTKKIKIPNLPAFLLKLIYGEMAIILLQGSRVTFGKIIEAGFTFKYSKIEDALDHLLNQKK